MKYKYISSIPKPLLKDFVAGKVIPFVGAGFSKNADIPEGLSMPDWNELGKRISEDIPDYTYGNNAVDALSYYEDLFSRSKLVEALMNELLVGKVQPGKTYEAFCDLFTGTICTTNFDSLLEDTMVMLQRPVTVIVTKDRLTIGNTGENRILKLHGDFNHPKKMVITEHDYDVYLEKNPIFATYVANLFITNTMLLIGYSLDDTDFRSIWQIINNRLGDAARPAYCLAVGISPEKEARYRRRNIKVINLKGKPKDYKTILRDFFIEVKNYVSQEKDKTARSTSERINEQMVIPAEDNKLCFVSCSMPRISRLSALIDPILRDRGITPVRIDDMLMPGDNWIDISRTAIRKSKAAIVDVSDSSPNVMLELGLIKSAKAPQNTLIICEENKASPIALDVLPVLRYSFDIFPYGKESSFSTAFDKWLCKVFEIETSLDSISFSPIFVDARRLLEKKEYSACIVSAYSELEYQLSARHADDWEFSRNSFRYLRKYMEDVHDPYMLKKYDFNRFIELRNKIVHQNYKATSQQARDFLDVAEAILNADRTVPIKSSKE